MNYNEMKLKELSNTYKVMKKDKKNTIYLELEDRLKNYKEMEDDLKKFMIENML